MSFKRKENDVNSRIGKTDSPIPSSPSVILRIKRKRDVDPITALRIETAALEDENDAQELIDNDNKDIASSPPLDKDRLKRSKLSDRGIFRLAETVSMSSFQDAIKTQQLEERLAKLKKPSTISETNKEIETPLKITNSSQLRFKVISNLKSSSSKRSLLDTIKLNGSSSSLQRQMKQHHKRSQHSKSKSLQKLEKPPTIVSVKKKPFTRYIDAIVDNKDEDEKDFEAEDDEINKLDKRFAGLLGDYLRDQDLSPPKLKNEKENNEIDGDDYVYDVYYRVKEDKPQDFISTEMATLVGLPEDDYMDEEELENGSKLVSEELLDSDDPYEEGEDEDSNDEGFYRNDYPEQELDDDSDDAYGWTGPRKQRNSESEEEESGEDEDDEF